VYIDTDRCDDCAPGFCEAHGEMLENPRPEYLTFELSWEEMRDFANLGQPDRKVHDSDPTEAILLAKGLGAKIYEALARWGLT
jgi:hypothetical protein